MIRMRVLLFTEYAVRLTGRDSFPAVIDFGTRAQSKGFHNQIILLQLFMNRWKGDLEMTLEAE